MRLQTYVSFGVQRVRLRRSCATSQLQRLRRRRKSTERLGCGQTECNSRAFYLKRCTLCIVTQAWRVVEELRQVANRKQIHFNALWRRHDISETNAYNGTSTMVRKHVEHCVAYDCSFINVEIAYLLMMIMISQLSQTIREKPVFCFND